MAPPIDKRLRFITTSVINLLHPRVHFSPCPAKVTVKAYSLRGSLETRGQFGGYHLPRKQ